MKVLLQDVAYGFRQFRKTPSFGDRVSVPDVAGWHRTAGRKNPRTQSLG
jgi:hypothetical protein